MTSISTLLLHPRTKAMLELYLKRPTHGLVLIGQEGSGKLHLVRWLAGQLGAEIYLVAAAEDKSVITIEQIRQLYSLTRTGTQLLIVIKDSHQLGSEAQNAFLKLLEEPPTGTRFVLTAHTPQSLLPTIRSRLQAIEVLPPPKQQLEQILAASQPEGSALTSLIHTVGHLPGQFMSALNDETNQAKQAALLQAAKQFYSSNAYNRLSLLQANNYDKTWGLALLHNLTSIVRALLASQARAGKSSPRLLTQAQLIEETHRNIFSTPGNPKIQLTNLALNL